VNPMYLIGVKCKEAATVGWVLSHSSSNKHQSFSVYSTVLFFGVMLFGE
jgi:hypothetical protein